MPGSNCFLRATGSRQLVAATRAVVAIVAAVACSESDGRKGFTGDPVDADIPDTIVAADVAVEAAARCGDGPPPPLSLSTLAAGLRMPVFVTSPPNDATRLFVVERAGRVQLVDASETRLVLDVSDRVDTQNERGMFSLAFHPQYGEGDERRFWIYYNDSSGASVIAGYTATSVEPFMVEATSEQVLLSVAQPASNHNGGMIAFGPDGMLYVGLGDGGGANDTFGNGQNAATQLGSMLRVDVDAYPTPPPGNLPGAHPDVVHVGLRNPWRFSFDRATGDLYIGDVGQNLWEEVDVVPPGGNYNFGWPITEGDHCFASSDCDRAGLIDPVDEYANPGGGRSVVGGYVYRGARIPGLVGRYLYADFYSLRFWSFIASGDTICERHEITDDIDPTGALNGVASFGQDARGEVYVVGMGTGEVLRIDPE